MKNILIIGASAGIGYGIVLKYLAEGYNVYAISRNIDSLIELKSNNYNLHIIQADTTNNIDQVQILERMSIVESFDIINNAAYGSPTTFSQTNFEEIKKHFDTNVFAPLCLIQTLLSQNKISKVLNVSSGAAEFPLQSLLSYCSSKAAIHHAMKCLNLEYTNTKFANLRPGMVDTPLQDRWRNVDDSVFPNGNFYTKSKEDKKLISVNTVADYTFWVMNQSLEIFAQDWNIANEVDQKDWLNQSSIYA